MKNHTKFCYKTCFFQDYSPDSKYYLDLVGTFSIWWAQQFFWATTEASYWTAYTPLLETTSALPLGLELSEGEKREQIKTSISFKIIDLIECLSVSTDLYNSSIVTGWNLQELTWLQGDNREKSKRNMLWIRLWKFTLEIAINFLFKKKGSFSQTCLNFQLLLRCSCGS